MALADAVCDILLSNPRDPTKAAARQAYVKGKFGLDAYVNNFERELDRLTI